MAAKPGAQECFTSRKNTSWASGNAPASCPSVSCTARAGQGCLLQAVLHICWGSSWDLPGASSLCGENCGKEQRRNTLYFRCVFCPKYLETPSQKICAGHAFVMPEKFKLIWFLLHSWECVPLSIWFFIMAALARGFGNSVLRCSTILLENFYMWI